MGKKKEKEKVKKEKKNEKKRQTIHLKASETNSSSP